MHSKVSRGCKKQGGVVFSQRAEHTSPIGGVFVCYVFVQKNKVDSLVSVEFLDRNACNLIMWACFSALVD